MTEEQIKLTIGALLHDIGRLLYRSGVDDKNYGAVGYNYLKNEIGITDETILHCVRYHDSVALSNASQELNNAAYIVTIAKSIASSSDKKKRCNDDETEPLAPLQSVFNLLNGNNAKLVYNPTALSMEQVNYPTESNISFTKEYYKDVINSLLVLLKKVEYTESFINKLMELLEEKLSFVPTFTEKDEICDISLFEHLKLTAAIALCVNQYLKDNDISDIKGTLFEHKDEFCATKAFCLYSMDVSGIQDFIYTISTTDALKILRARSFYLEIMMEHIINGVLTETKLSRLNLIYSGGGHCYLLIPNTAKTKSAVIEYNNRINDWLLMQFSISLFVADGLCECSSNDLNNNPSGSYSNIFMTVSDRISAKKNNRYSPSKIIELNKQEDTNRVRECRICKRADSTINDEGECSVCSALKHFSKSILYDDYFIVSKDEEKTALPLPLGYYLVSATEEDIKKAEASNDVDIYLYAKNKVYNGTLPTTKLWVGSYSSGKSFEQMAKEARGIDRIGILRADVDSLGHAFVAGFNNDKNDNKYVTISRTAMLSKHLSLFFKLYINTLLSNSVSSIDGKKNKINRNVTICYSGGDDLFIVGAWNEVIEAAIDIKEAFAQYTQGTLTVSGGIGIYQDSYPLSAIAYEVSELEEKSKKISGKDAITLLEDGYTHTELKQGNSKADIIISDGTYKWDEFINCVLSEKLKMIEEFFESSEDRGKNFLYNLLELIRGRSEKINFARYVYLLSRLEPADLHDEDSKKSIAEYRKFSTKMFEWLQNDKDSRELKTAINLYVYLSREVQNDNQ